MLLSVVRILPGEKVLTKITIYINVLSSGEYFVIVLKKHTMQTAESLLLQAKGRKNRATSLSVLQHQMTLSQGVIPAVRGEYYSYPSLFTKEQPLFALMKCKSNKVRRLSEISTLGTQINAFFQCEEKNSQVLSIKAAKDLGLLGTTRMKDAFDDIWFAPTNLSAEQFIGLRDTKETMFLVSACREALIERQIVLDIYEGLVVAFMTRGGKYGMFLVEDITFSSIQIEACHVLL